MSSTRFRPRNEIWSKVSVDDKVRAAGMLDRK